MYGNHRHATAYILLDSRYCGACWQCIEACPRGVIGKIELPFHKHARIADAGACQGCYKCVQVCPERAIVPLVVRQTSRQRD